MSQASRSAARLQFKSGEWFVSADDLHDTTWTTESAQATVYPTVVEAQAMADAMARTQGLRLVVVA